MIGLVFAGALAGGAILPGVAFAVPPGIEVCHFDDEAANGDPASRTLSVGSQKALDQHIANHTTGNGYEGEDFPGPC